MTERTSFERKIAMSQTSPVHRAEALIEALPYIQKFRGQTFVIKYGGSAMEDEHVIERLLRDIVFLEAVGINPILVHGGGKAITDRMREAGLKAKFVNGLRVTDANAIKIVEEVLDTIINPRLVARIAEFSGNAVGISGRKVFIAKKLPPQTDSQNVAADLGFTGEVVGLKIDAVREVLDAEKVPVISPISQSEDGQALNVNADIAAGAIAGELKAVKLIYLSDVPGIMRNPGEKDSMIPSVNREMIETLIEDEVIEGGMVPKVKSALAAIEKGVGKVHLIDGRVPHSLLVEIFTNSGIGTEIVS
ncbi:MAG TPA: acetylglutamate kinase [Chthoniobacteraceae bacterium]|jgi:acetylglutamate kinase|nr:acetylglutamate kinase [Chthoniobacteraceae bacterium]